MRQNNNNNKRSNLKDLLEWSGPKKKKPNLENKRLSKFIMELESSYKCMNNVRVED